MIIHPDIYTTPDKPTIRFKEPREKVDLDNELPKILHSQGWGCGTYFNVQFMNHEKTVLLASALYVVTHEIEGVNTSDANPYQPVTKTVFNRKAERIGDWWPRGIGKTTVYWNPGKKVHQVKINGDEVIYESADKEKALAAAAGDIPKVA